MKTSTRFLLILLSLFSFARANAQVLPPNQPEQNPCTPLELCGGGTTTAGSYQGVPNSNAYNLPGTGCLPGFTDVVFWQVTFSSAGQFVFTLTPTNACDDYDWVVYQIDPSLPCPANLASAVTLRSDANDIYNSPGGMTGLSTTAPIPGLTCQSAGTGPAFLDAINVTAGETLLVAINNAGTYGCPFGTSPAPVNISFSGSTAQFLDTVKPVMKYVESSCDKADGVIVKMNKAMQCNSIAADGSDFTVSGGTVASASGVNCLPGGSTHEIQVNFASPLPVGSYVLTVKVGSDGNTLLDICDTAVVVGDTVHFTVDPYVPITYANVVSPACSEIKIGLAAKVLCDSIAVDGSDFGISGPASVNVASAYGVGCDTNNLTDTVVILLQQPISADGTYTITAKKGSDGNILVDSCGHKQAAGNSITFNINSFDGLLTAGPHDTVLCQSGYLNFRTTNTATPPDSTLVCGTEGIPCTGTGSHNAYAFHDSTSSVNSPFYGYGKSRMQMLYTADELKMTGMKAGAIQAIGWQVLTASSGVAFEDLTIKIGCTGLTALDNGFVGGLQMVSTTASYSSSAGWNMFTLNTPFNWDGVSNLIVEVCDNNSSSSFSADVVQNGVTSFTSVQHIYSTSTSISGCSLIPGSSTTDVGNHHLRPKTRFDVCPAPPGHTFTYNWTPSAYLSSVTAPDPSAYALNTTKYTVKIVDRNGCTHRDTVHVTVSVRNPTLEPHNDTALCLGKTYTLLAGGGNSYSWYGTDISSLSCANCSNPTVTPTVSGTYHVIIADRYNCKDTLSQSVTVWPIPNVVARPHDTTVAYGVTVQLYATGAFEYIWSPANLLNNSFIPNPVALATEPQAIVVLGVDSNGCRASDTVNLNINYRSPIMVPSAFTPNNDGKNDRFRVAGLTNQRVIEFRVFNRWGQQVFSTDNNEIGWDGTSNGEPQDIGVYKYLIRVTYPDGFIETYRGDVTLIR